MITKAEQRLTEFCLKCFFWISGITFVYVFATALFWNRSEPIPLLFNISVCVGLIAAAEYWLRKHDEEYTAFLQNDMLRRLAVIALLVLFAVIQGYFARTLMMDQTQEIYDIRPVRNVAAFVLEHPFTPSDQIPELAYFMRYENNQFILCVVTLWFMLCRVVAPMGDYEVFGAILNVLSSTAAMGLTYLAARNFFGTKKGFPVLIAWLFFIPFYGYAPTYYTDILSLPFITLTMFSLSCFYKTKKIRYVLLAGMASSAGTMMKGTLTVFLVAALIWLIFLKGTSIAKRLVCVGLCVAMVICTGAGFKYFYQHCGLYGVAPTDHEGMAYPFTHWLMMAQNGEGPYNSDDVEFSMSLGNTYRYRRETCWEQCIDRIRSRDMMTNLLFANRKVVAVWGDGTCEMKQWMRPYSYHPYSVWNKRFDPGNPQDSVPWHRAMDAYWFTMLLAFVGTCLSRLKNKAYYADGQFLYQLALFGMFLFQLLWEWHSRYLLAYVPILFSLFPIGIGVCYNQMQGWLRKIKLAKSGSTNSIRVV